MIKSYSMRVALSALVLVSLSGAPAFAGTRHQEISNSSAEMSQYYGFAGQAVASQASSQEFRPPYPTGRDLWGYAPSQQ
jgi:hypothetical protein